MLKETLKRCPQKRQFPLNFKSDNTLHKRKHSFQLISVDLFKFQIVIDLHVIYIKHLAGKKHIHRLKSRFCNTKNFLETSLSNEIYFETKDDFPLQIELHYSINHFTYLCSFLLFC